MNKAISALIIALLVTVCSLSSGEANPDLRSSASQSHTIVLPYAAFGPQSMAHETIGFEWYQWNRVGSCDPNAPQDDVKVVVFRGITLQEARKQYPVVENKSDYRYLSYIDAIQYLHKNEKEMSEIKDEDWAIRLADLLRTTREKIIEALGR